MIRRTPLQRSTKPIKRTPLARSMNLIPPRRRGGKRRVSVDRNPEYRAWLRERKCVVCLKIGTLCERVQCDPCHTTVNGTGSKGPDSGCYPGCRFHHTEQHQVGMKDFEAKYGIDLKHEAEFHFAAFSLLREADL